MQNGNEEANATEIEIYFERRDQTVGACGHRHGTYAAAEHCQVQTRGRVCVRYIATADRDDSALREFLAAGGAQYDGGKYDLRPMWPLAMRAGMGGPRAPWSVPLDLERRPAAGD